ncbi:MAG TPA: LuxR C-terminal-related transcriptional regulator [Nocardioides sp.]|nr:LuxR C-terminal-related transcriptional regulator [Nocardioides sp.]
MQAPDATARGNPVLARARELTRLGEVNAALTHLERLRASGELARGCPDEAVLLATTIDCRLARGDLGEAMALGDELDPCLDLPGTAGALAHLARGELASALSEPELAATHFATAGALVAGPDEDVELVPWRAGLALASVRLGRRPEAAALATEQLEHARATGSPYAVAYALRTLASTDTGSDRVLLLREARLTLAAVIARRLAAQIDTDLAGLLVLTGGKPATREALGLLRGVEEYAGNEELWPLQGRVRRLFERLGETPRRVQGEAFAVLTLSERRVARLAATGRTNRDIADELVVTVKAVEWHLSNVYRKLGIRSRRGLAASLGTTR